MNRIRKINIVVILVFLGMLISVSNTVIAVDPVADITVEPLEPEPLSTVTFTANITSEDAIDEVYIKIKECKPGLCFSIENVSMSPSGDKYTLDYELKYSEATYFDYWLEIKSGGSWFTTEKANVTLKVAEDNNDDTNDTTPVVTEDDDEGIPGFELITLLFAIIVGVFLFKRKR